MPLLGIFIYRDSGTCFTQLINSKKSHLDKDKERLNLAKDLTELIKTSARGSVILILGNIISTLVLALGVILVARFLGSTTYGEINIASIPYSIAILVGDIGINSALIKYISLYRHQEKTEEIKVLIKTGLLINTFVGSILSLIVFLLADTISISVFNNFSLGILIKLLSLNILSQVLFTTAQSIFIGYEKMEFYSITYFIYSILKSILAPLLIKLGYGITGAVIGQILPVVICAIIGIAIVILYFMVKLPNGNYKIFDTSKKLLVYGWPLFLSNIINGITTQVFNLMLAIYTTAYFIGNYNAILNFATLITLFSIPISNTMFPLLSKISYLDKDNFGMIYKYSVKYASIITIPVITIIVCIPGTIINIIFPRTYNDAPLFLQLFALNYLSINFGSLSIANILNSQGRTDITFKMSIISTLTILPLGFILIPKYGVFGLLIVNLLNKSSLIYGLWWIKKNYGIDIDWNSSIKILLIFLSSIIFEYIFFIFFSFDYIYQLIISSIIILSIYLIMLPLTGVINFIDIKNFKVFTNSIKPLAFILEFIIKIEKQLVEYSNNANKHGDS